jgi:hypothetical protein
VPETDRSLASEHVSKILTSHVNKLTNLNNSGKDKRISRREVFETVSPADKMAWWISHHGCNPT